MERIDGKAIAQRIRARVRDSIAASGVTPLLAAVLVGENSASELYLKLKAKACAEVGIAFERMDFPARTPPEEIIAAVETLNEREDVHGILLQMPLPESLDPDPIVAAMDPTKDVDGFHPLHLEAIEEGQDVMLPVLVKAALALIAETGTGLAGKRAVMLAKSDVFSRPFRCVFGRLGATLTVMEQPNPDLTRNADILVSALGRPYVINADAVGDGAVVIDIGITPVDGKVYGDVDPAGMGQKRGWLTPVPGGVGPVTVAMLMENTALAAGVSIA